MDPINSIMEPAEVSAPLIPMVLNELAARVTIPRIAAKDKLIAAIRPADIPFRAFIASTKANNDPPIRINWPIELPNLVAEDTDVTVLSPFIRIRILPILLAISRTSISEMSFIALIAIFKAIAIPTIPSPFVNFTADNPFMEDDKDFINTNNATRPLANMVRSILPRDRIAPIRMRTATASPTNDIALALNTEPFTPLTNVIRTPITPNNPISPFVRTSGFILPSPLMA